MAAWKKLLTSLSQDTDPTLGADLDVAGHSIVSSSNTIVLSGTMINCGSAYLWDGSVTLINVAQMKTAYDNRVTDNVRKHSLSVAFDGGGSALTVGSKIFAVQPSNPDASLTWDWALLADVSGSVTVKIYHCGAYHNSPAYSPTSTTEITPTGGISISSATRASGAISMANGWNVSNMVSGRVFRFEITACSTITRLTVLLLQSKQS